MKEEIFLILLMTSGALAGFSQEVSVDTIVKRGSYLYYGQPNIEDNSMFIEEAFNQERAVIQHISNLIIVGNKLQYVYTQEIPMPTEKHQLSIGIVHNSNQNSNDVSSGFGDLFINYRPMLRSKTDWALVIPRFTLIAPTGDAKYGFGTGGWGVQFNLAVTKRLNKKITTHWNAGATEIFNDHHYMAGVNGDLELNKMEHHNSFNLGLSAIYLVSNSINFMCEYTCTRGQVFDEEGNTGTSTDMIVNPGFRFAFNLGVTQIVPGLGIPLFFENGRHASTGNFIYLSIEPNY
jgi:hypothetical protein